VAEHPGIGHRILVIFSDMRNDTRDLDIESSVRVPSFAQAEGRHNLNIPNLREVEIYVLGIDGVGEDTAYWSTLTTFWTDFFDAAGATVRSYSALRYFAWQINRI
jgi:hypothetical protein